MKEHLQNLKERTLAGLAAVLMPFVFIGLLVALSSHLKKEHEKREKL